MTDKQKDTRKGRPYGRGGRLVLSPLSAVPLIAVCLLLRKETHEKAGERSSPLRVRMWMYKRREQAPALRMRRGWLVMSLLSSAPESLLRVPNRRKNP